LSRAPRGLGRRLLLALAALVAAPAGAEDPKPAAGARPPIQIRVMTFNVEHGGTGVDIAKVVEALERARPDIVGLEEAEGNAPAIAAALGFEHVDRRSDVISRHPILDPPGGDGRFVLVEVRPAEVVAVANVHLPSDPYGPSLVARGEPLEAVLALERRLRLPAIEPVLAAVAALEGVPTFLLGDFNAPSRRDWTAASTGRRPHLRYPVEWPVSAAVERAGFVDSYRAVHADPVRRPGLTWWAARPPGGDDFSLEPRDRIDFVHAAGPARAVRSEIVGEAGAADVDLAVTPWPSDHRAVVSTFEVRPAPMPVLLAVNAQRRVETGGRLLVDFFAPEAAGLRLAIVPEHARTEALEPARLAAAVGVAPGRGAVELATEGLAPGRYEVVLLAGRKAALSRIPFVLGEPAAATELRVDRAVYEPGQEIGVRWRNGPGHRWDWIGIFPGSAAPSAENLLLWRHTRTAIDGQLSFDGTAPETGRWPLAPGEYRAVYLLDDAYEMAASARFSVREPPASVRRAPAAALAVGLARAPFAPDSGSLGLRCGRLVDGVSDAARESVAVWIERGRIAAVGEALEFPAGAPVLDLAGHTCLPGLIDLHTHLTDAPGDTADLRVYYRRTLEEQVALGRENARRTLLAGFTSVRDVGTYVAWSDRALRDEIARGRAIGPRMQVSGFYLTVPGGGGDLLIPGVPEAEIPALVRTGVARGPEQFRRRAELAVAGGADLLKVIASGAVLAFGGVPAEPEMTPQEIRAVVEVAHAAGRKVAAHAHGARSIKEAILAGVDTIEHASLIDEEAIALARERGVALSMDVYNGSYIDSEGRRQGWPDEFLRKNLETTEAQRQGFERAHRVGAPIVFGTDSAVYPHGWNARQFEVMVERGMTPVEAVKSATSLAARAMGWSDRVGSIAPGLLGDLIAVEGDPLADVRRLQDVAVVIQGGLAFKLPGERREAAPAVPAGGP
jgi:imidazolonepropionase-like amidohydrolase/endonuclease/exonuclease/phosphatase family metal-dependent hydrolase